MSFPTRYARRCGEPKPGVCRLVRERQPKVTFSPSRRPARMVVEMCCQHHTCVATGLPNQRQSPHCTAEAANLGRWRIASEGTRQRIEIASRRRGFRECSRRRSCVARRDPRWRRLLWLTLRLGRRSDHGPGRGLCNGEWWDLLRRIAMFVSIRSRFCG